MCLQMLPPSYQKYMGTIIELMKNNLNENHGIKESEFIKMKRMLSWMESQNPYREKEQTDFKLFFREHDKRRKTNFPETFPEYSDLIGDGQ